MSEPEELAAELLAVRVEYVELVQQYAERIAALEAALFKARKQAASHASDTVRFLRARLDEDEARYRETVESLTGWAEGSADLNEGYILGEAQRALTEAAVKRRILDHAERPECWASTLHIAPDGWTAQGVTAYRVALDWVLGQLASIYADHPDHPAVVGHNEATRRG